MYSCVFMNSKTNDFDKFALIYSLMTKSTSEVSTFFVFKSSPEAFISPLFQKIILPRSRATLPHIIWLALGFLPSLVTPLLKSICNSLTFHQHFCDTWQIFERFYTTFIHIKLFISNFSVLDQTQNVTLEKKVLVVNGRLHRVTPGVYTEH